MLCYLQQGEVMSLQSQLDLAKSETNQLKELFETMKKNEVSMNEKMNELNEKYNKVILCDCSHSN